MIHHPLRPVGETPEEAAAGDLRKGPLLDRRGEELEQQRRDCPQRQPDRDRHPTEDAVARQRDQQHRDRDQQPQAVQPLEHHDRRADTQRHAVAAAPQVRPHEVAACGRRQGARGLAHQLDGHHVTHRHAVVEVSDDHLRAVRTQDDHWHVERQRPNQRQKLDLLQRCPDAIWVADGDDCRGQCKAEHCCHQPAGPEGTGSTRRG